MTPLVRRSLCLGNAFFVCLFQLSKWQEICQEICVWLLYRCFLGLWLEWWSWGYCNHLKQGLQLLEFFRCLLAGKIYAIVSLNAILMATLCNFSPIQISLFTIIVRLSIRNKPVSFWNSSMKVVCHTLCVSLVCFPEESQKAVSESHLWMLFLTHLGRRWPQPGAVA